MVITQMKLLQDLMPRHRIRYSKLLRDEPYDDDDNNDNVNAHHMKPPPSSSSPPRRRCFWVKKMNGRLTKGVKISRSSRRVIVKWKRFSLLVFPRKIARIYSEVVKKLIELDGCSVIFATTWGIPVISNNLCVDRI